MISEKEQARIKKIHEKLTELAELGCKVTQMSSNEIKIEIKYEWEK